MVTKITLTIAVVLIIILTYIAAYPFLDIASPLIAKQPNWNTVAASGYSSRVCSIDLLNPKIITVIKSKENIVQVIFSQYERKNIFQKFEAKGEFGLYGIALLTSDLSNENTKSLLSKMDKYSCKDLEDNKYTGLTYSPYESDKFIDYKKMKEKMEQYQNLSTEEKIKLCEKDQVYWQGLIDAYKRGDKNI